MESEAARLLAVRRVTEENQGKHTAGVDGVKSLTSQECLAMASIIHPNHWKHQPPMPVRRVWVPKPGTAERRPLAILPMIDRCKQALVKLALEPEWEVRFEPHSYGYRPGRSTHDAIAAILVAIERHPCFVFHADIEGAFDNVNQAVILDKLQTFPALRQAINAWLTAGVIDGTTYFSSKTGIAQGGVLSPLLMNVALHGMEGEILRFAQNDKNVAQNDNNSQNDKYNIQNDNNKQNDRNVRNERRGRNESRERPLVGREGEILRFAQNDKYNIKNDNNKQNDSNSYPLLVRYADDFVILHADLKELQRAVKRVRQWLATMGLRLHADKTRFTHTLTPYQGRVGFDFLGFNIHQELVENSPKGQRGQEHSPGVKTIIRDNGRGKTSVRW